MRFVIEKLVDVRNHPPFFDEFARYDTEAEALEDLAYFRKNHPRWTFRLVEEVVTYRVIA